MRFAKNAFPALLSAFSDRLNIPEFGHALSQAGSHQIRVPALVESSTARGTSRTQQADSSVTNIAVPKISSLFSSYCHVSDNRSLRTMVASDSAQPKINVELQ
jgi:hypothetical protein